MPSLPPPTGSLSDRLRGALLGLAAGDRNGGPLRMALCLGDSLLACCALDTDHLLGRYLAWWRADGVDCGPTADEVFRLVAQGVPARRALEEVHLARGGLTAGCNPAHRAMPLALVGFLADEQLPAQARAESALTHCHALAGDVSAAVVVLCRALVRGVEWEEALGSAAGGRLPETRSALREAPEGPDAGGFAPDVLRSAVSFVHRAADFAEALRNALEFAGPANY